MRRKIDVLLGYSRTDGRVAVFARVPEEDTQSGSPVHKHRDRLRARSG